MDDNPLEWLAREVPQPERGQHPPVESWHPEKSGRIDIRIARNGDWFHEGEPFTRIALVRLFASILRREPDGRYFLVTPAEKLEIEVEDALFLVTALEPKEIAGQAVLEFTTSVGDRVRADAQHPLWVEVADISGEPSPYVLIRPGLHARLARVVYYQLVALATEEAGETGTELVVYSGGNRFCLGRVD